MQPDEPQDTQTQPPEPSVPAAAVPPSPAPEAGAPNPADNIPTDVAESGPSADTPADITASPAPEAPPAYPQPVDGLSGESIVVGGGSEPAGSNRKMPVTAALVVLVALVAVGGFYAFKNPKAGVSSSAGSHQAADLLPATTPPAAVSITGSGFSPATVSVKAGQAVVWTNSDSKPHFVTSDDPKPTGNTPDPKSGQAIAAGGSYDYVFSKAGTYTYHDDLNPGSGFKGVVVVK